MHPSEAHAWLQEGVRRQELLQALLYPCTVKQLSTKTKLALSRCSDVLWELSLYQLVRCLNPEARRGRVYAVTDLGQVCRQMLSPDETPAVTINAEIASLLGWVSFNHRAAVLKAIEGVLQPCQMKRRARFQNPAIRMSNNNVRDIVKLFRERGIVQQLWFRGRGHPRYALTEVGLQLQDLLRRAETPP